MDEREIHEELKKLLVGRENRPEPVFGEERERAFDSMQRIRDLKPGDRVRIKQGYDDQKFPEVGEVVEVFRVFAVPRHNYDKNGAGAAAFNVELDFTILYRAHGIYIEYAYDSRRFERA